MGRRQSAAAEAQHSVTTAVHSLDRPSGLTAGARSEARFGGGMRAKRGRLGPRVTPPQGCHGAKNGCGSTLRTGFTTGACAAAAAAAATRCLLTGQAVTGIAIDLPTAPATFFPIDDCVQAEGKVTCAVVKDAGDDPDVTQGTRICATVEWRSEPGVTLLGGQGVGVVTRPGLPLPVGEPAINPGPRRLIQRAVLAEAGTAVAGRGLQVTITVPDGERLAGQTYNPRLGIVGGISILGTTGIEVPYSQSAYRASINLELRVAAANGSPRAVLTTGRRSESYVRSLHPDWPEWSIVDVGDHMDYALRQVRRLAFRQVVIAGMIGKVSKLAQGRTRIHVDDGTVDVEYLSTIAAGLGAGDALVTQLRAANTAHHAQVLLRHAGITGLEERLAGLAAGQVFALLEGTSDVEVLLYHLQGELLGVGRMARAG